MTDTVRPVSVLDIATAHTPPGGYGAEMPAPILGNCVDPLDDDAPDLRGTWRVVDAWAHGERLGVNLPIWRHVERVEQAANRVVITAGGVIHDMVADGTDENGVNDVAAADFTTPVVVAASFEHHVLVLRPRDVDGVEVCRWREGDHIIWQYHTLFVARLQQVT